MLESMIEEYQIDMIQWYNLNIDPEWYWETMKQVDQEGIGIEKMINRIRRNFPKLRHGYFIPCLKP